MTTNRQMKRESRAKQKIARKHAQEDLKRWREREAQRKADRLSPSPRESELDRMRREYPHLFGGE